MATSHMSGPLAVSSYPSMALTLPGIATTLSAASGTILQKWRVVLPNFPTKLMGIGIAFTRGATNPPQGGTMSFKAWSGGTGKGLFSGSVAGATAEAVYLVGSATFPASGHLQLSVNTVGGTSGGRGASPTLYLSGY